jgi:hypothetical protein
LRDVHDGFSFFAFLLSTNRNGEAIGPGAIACESNAAAIGFQVADNLIDGFLLPHCPRFFCQDSYR